MNLQTNQQALKIRMSSDGIHIFDRITGTNILIDELQPPESLWTISPRQISIALTNSCDLSCTHCYAPKKSASLNKELVKKWMLELDQAGCFGIGFGGGEPTLHPSFAELCIFGKEKTNMAISFTTHGLRLTEKLINEIKGSVNFARISMDGTGDRYEAIRGRPFTTLLSKLELIKNQLHFGINFVVNNSTINDLDEAAIIAEDFGATEFLVLPEEPIGRGVKVDFESLTKLKLWISNYSGNLRLAISSTFKAEFGVESPLALETDDMAFAHINAEGILMRTSFSNAGEKVLPSGVMETFKNLRPSHAAEAN